MFRIIYFFLLLICFYVLPAAALELIVNAEPRGEIVVSPDATDTEIFVAGDFRRIIREMTSVELPLVKAASVKNNTKIFIGKKFASEFKKDLASLKETDGFAIRSRGNHIYIFGDNPRGTGYGAYHLLETNTDIIWARPDVNFGTVFSKTANIVLNKINVLEKNVFPIHGWNVVAVRGDEATGIWVFRNRGNIAELTNTPYLQWLDVTGHGHAYWRMAHPDQYFKTHPEFYGFNELKGGRTPETLCLTNDQLIRIAAENMIKDMKVRYPATPQYMMLGMRDSWAMCQCEICLRPIKLPDGSELKVRDRDAQKDPVYYSTRYFEFMNKVVREIKKQYPEMKFLVSSYFYAAEPPACDIDKSIYINFCPIGGVDSRYPLLDARQDPTWRRRFEGWLKKAPGRLCFYEYYRSYASGSAVVTAALSSQSASVANLRILAEKGSQGVESELTPDSEKLFSNHTMKSEWDANSINGWIYARLFWNPYEDVDKLRDYYIVRTFREAAPAMKRFYELMALGAAKSTKPKGKFLEKVIDTGVEKECRAALDEAERLAKHPNSLEMIKRLKNQWKINAEGVGRQVVPIMNKSESFFEFDAPCWEKAITLEDFRIPAYKEWGAKNPARQETKIKVLHDDANLYFLSIAKTARPRFMPRAASEKFPGRERCEIYLRNGKTLYLFAFDGNGNMYDAKDFDKRWNSKWKVSARKSADSWQAIVSIPMTDLGLIAAGSVPQRLAVDVIRVYDDGETREESTIKGELSGRQRGFREIIME